MFTRYGYQTCSKVERLLYKYSFNTNLGKHKIGYKSACIGDVPDSLPNEGGFLGRLIS